MRVVIQRTLNSSVVVSGECVAEIKKGLNLLACIEVGDTEKIIKKAAQKILNLRLFADRENGKMDLTVGQVEGEIIAISQFTLSWKGQKGNRPSFDGSMPPETAKSLFTNFCQYLSEDVKVSQGVFGANMLVNIENDGPVTFVLDFAE